MKVILLKELKGRGGEGDVIEVARGYANNYLLTQGYAVKATPGALKQLEERKKNIAKREEVRLADANALKEQLDAVVVKVVAQVGEEGQLFGSVGSVQIAEALKADFDIDVDKRRIELGIPIKKAGEHKVPVSLYRDVKAMLTVLVGGPEIKAVAESEEPAVAEAAEAEEAAPVAEEAAPAAE